MCKGNACGCGGSSPFPLGLALALLAVAAAASALASLLLHLLVVLAVAAGVVAVAGVAYTAWRVRVLTRPAQRRPVAAQLVVRELAARPRLAIEAPRAWYGMTTARNSSGEQPQMMAGMTEPGEVAGGKRRAPHP